MNPYRVEDKVLCHRRSTIVRPKAVFARPNVSKFLEEVSEIAHRVVMWTTMLKHNAKGIVRHLFNGCRPPYDILSQEQCTKIEVSRGKFFHLNVQLHCLKDLNDAFSTTRVGTRLSLRTTPFSLTTLRTRVSVMRMAKPYSPFLGAALPEGTTASLENFCPGLGVYILIARLGSCVNTLTTTGLV